jgi:PAS domain S-box-containing protein
MRIFPGGLAGWLANKSKAMNTTAQRPGGEPGALIPALPPGRPRLLNVAGWTLAVAWTAAIASSLIYSFKQESQNMFELARAEARTSFQTDMLYRHWVSSQGGVYVPTTGQTPPNPHLTKGVERDLTTVSGQRLTLVNPSYMNQQVHELGRQLGIASGHFTRLKPIQTGNAADAWETNALLRLESGEKEFASLENLGGQPHLRFMRALIIEKSCLTCHVKEGYQEGERHGGMSVSVDMAPYEASGTTRNHQDVLAHVGLWLLGLGGLGGGFKLVSRRMHDREVAVARLQAVETELADFYEHAPDMFLLLDVATSNVLGCNSTLLERTGRGQEEIIGRPLAGLGQPVGTAQITDALEQFRRSGEIRHLEFQLPTARGTVLEVELNATAILDEQGRMVRGRVVLRDITEPKRLEAALRESEQRFRSLVATSLDAVLLTTPAGEILSANVAACAMFHCAEEELLRVGRHGVVDLTDSRMRAFLTERERTGRFHGEVTLVRRDGAKFPAEISSAVFHTEEGALRTSMVIRDITERKRAEEALRASEAFTRTILDNLPVGIAVNTVDPSVSFSYMNDNFPRFYRTTREQLANPDAFWSVVYENPEFREEMRKRVLEDCASGDVERMCWADVPITRKEEGTVFITARNISLPDKRLMISIVWDVTERKRAEVTREAFLALGTMLSASRNPTEAARTIFATADKLWNWDSGTLDICSLAGDQVSSVLNFDIVDGERREVPSVRASGQLTPRIRRIMAHGPELILRTPPYTQTSDSVVFGDPTRLSASIMCVSVRSQGKPIGVLSIQSYTPNAFSEEDMRTLQALADHCGGALERIQVQEALLESDELYRALVGASPNAISVTDLEGRIVFVSPKALELFGESSVAEVNGRSMMDWVSRDEQERAYANLRHLIVEGQLRETEYILVKKDGARFSAEVNAAILRSADGSPSRIIFVTRDITERKVAEAALRESQGRLSLFFSQSLDGFYFSMLDEPKEWNEHTDKEEVLDYVSNHQPITEVNDAMLAQYGATRESFLGRPISTFFQHDLEQGRRFRRRLFDEGRLHVETNERKLDGTPIWIEGDYVCMYDEQHRIIGTFGIQREITERKQAEAALRRRGKILEAVGLAAARFFQVSDWRETMLEVLGRLGQAARVSRVVVFENQLGVSGEILWSRTFEWAAAADLKLQAGDPSLVNIPVQAGGFTRWAELLARGEVVQGNVREFPPSEQPALIAHQIRSILAVPILVAGQWWGFLAFDECAAERTWQTDEVEALRAAASILGAAIQRIRSEQALRESERLLQLVMDVVPHFIFAKDRQSRNLFVNRACADAAGLTPAQMVGRCDLDFVPDRTQAEAFMRDDREVIATGRPTVNREEQLTDATGHTRILQTTKIPITMPGTGEPALVGVALDITERKLTETKLRIQSAALEAAANGIALTDRNGVLLWANQAFLRMTGYTLKEVIGGKPSLLKSGQHDAAFYRGLWTTILRGEVWHGELINRRKDGSLYPEEMTITPIPDSSGGIGHFIAIKQDITQRKNLETQFRQAQKMDAIGQLSGGVAHDFNNILCVILGHTSLLQLPGLTPDEHADSVQQINRAAERATNLTRQLLTFSRRTVMQTQALDLNEVTAGMTKMLQRLIGEHVVLQTRYAPEGAPVQADPGMMEQVLLNLAVNARDAMPEGGEIFIQTERVRVDPARASQRPNERPGDFICLSVRDTGCGIAPENLPRIFEPFFTTKEVGKGTGLGLATVFGIVEQQKGWIEVESEIGRGTTFHVFLPRLSDTAAQRASQTAAPQPRGGHETILVVEDEPGLRALTRNALERYGYHVHEAASGKAALEVWRQHQGEIELLLTDLVMPGGVSGRELAGQLRADRPQLKLIYMSGYPGDVAARGLSLHEGINFLQKPFSPTRLAEILRKALDAG